MTCCFIAASFSGRRCLSQDHKCSSNFSFIDSALQLFLTISFSYLFGHEKEKLDLNHIPHGL